MQPHQYRQLGRRARALAPVLLVPLLALWLLWPQHAGGYGLGHDMVFTPHQPLTADSVGLGSSSPRAVPLDALVALVSSLLGGVVTGRLALLVPLLAAGWGTLRLLDSRCLPARLLAAGLAVWNPFVVERLALGQWALLWAYGALPWLVLAAHRLRTGPASLATPAGRSNWAVLGCCLAASAITPTGALIGAACALVVGWTNTRRTGALAGAAVAVQLPWLLPAMLSTAAATSDPGGVSAFAARAERPGGALLSLLGLGGIWSSDVTPASRAGVLGYLGTAVVVAALLFGLPRLAAAGWRFRLVLLAGAALLVAAAGTLPGLKGLLGWAVRVVPGAGLLRDGQKWLIPFVLLAVLAAGAAVEPLASASLVDRFDRSWRQPWRALLATGALVLPLLLLPDGPATLRVPLTPVHYPADWTAVSGRLAGTDHAVLVLPFASYRAYPWAPGRTVLDPAPRWLAAPAVLDDRLAVSGRLLAGEDASAAAVGRVLAENPAPAELASALAGRGIGWVLVEADTAGPPLPDLSGLRPTYAGTSLRLYQVPGQIAEHQRSRSDRWLVIGTDLVIAVLIALAIAMALASKGPWRRRRLLHSPVTTTSEDL